MLFFRRDDNERGRQGRYPLTFDLICTQIPALPANKPAVWDAFKARCGDDNRARQALRFGNEPFVDVMLLYASGEWDQRHPAVGQYRGRDGGSRRRIYINRLLIEAFERRQSGELRLIVEATLLHETVHYVRDRSGAASPFTDNDLHEAGRLFEEQAYGRWLGRDAYSYIEQAAR
jgi:hypothetical protein